MCAMVADDAGCHSAGDGVVGVWPVPVSDDLRNTGISNWVGWSVNQDGKSERWPAGVLRTVDGVILVLLEPAPLVLYRPLTER